MNRPFLVLSVLIGALALAGLAQGQETIRLPKAEDAAVPAAEAWLKLVDTGNYAESWKAAAADFKRSVSQRKWKSLAPALRQPLGAVVSRKLKSTEPTRELPGAPDGEYVVIQFVTEFANKKSATETVIPIREKDGVWRISSYVVK